MRIVWADAGLPADYNYRQAYHALRAQNAQLTSDLMHARERIALLERSITDAAAKVAQGTRVR